MVMTHAEQLFCWHAFFQPSPPAEFQTLVEDFLKACNGLPLSLKVLGAQLCGRKSKDYWESLLQKILRICPGEIKKRLQVSYDPLDDEEKKMFLDVACFLIGEEKNKAIAVWNGSRWSGVHGLETLVNKCLVELVEEEVAIIPKLRRDLVRMEKSTRIRMHDQLRDMGREIASRQSPYRLWCPQQIHDKMKPSTKRNPVRGILPGDSFVAFKEYTRQLTGKTIRRSKRLRFSYELQILSVNGNEFTEEFASLSQDLVWLRWEDFPLKNVPSWLTLKNIMVLELHGAYELEQLWQDDAEPPLKLSELILTGCGKLQRFPSSFKNLQDLKSLTVEFVGSSLSEDQFCVLPSLQNLHLSSLMLSSLPDDFGNLRSLRNLSLQSCEQLSMLPDSFSQLIHLTDLNFSYCEIPSSLPDGFGNLTCLKNLSLERCLNLEMLPDSFSQLIHLTHLDLELCVELSSLPDDFGYLTSLTNLNMYFCSKLTMLPDSFSQLIHLTHLDLSYCTELSSLDDFGYLTSLTNLSMFRCSKLTMLPDSFSQLIHLTHLDLSFCEMLFSLPDGFGNLTSLRNLEMDSCKQLSMLPDSFTQLLHLEILHISDCEMLYLVKLRSLKNLRLSKCNQLSVLPDSFTQLLHLTDLHLEGCEMISSLPEMLPVSLNELIISACHSLKSVKCISHGLTNLETLVICDCMQIEELPNFTGLTSLKKIRISKCPEVEKMEGLEHVKEFDMWDCPKVVKVQGLEHAKSLKALKLKTSWKEAGIQSLGNVERLEVLKLECETISALKPCIQSTKGKVLIFVRIQSLSYWTNVNVYD